MPAAPGLAEALLVVLRWLHGIAAIVFLGWSAVLWLDGPPRGDQSAARQRFKEITELTLLVFLATGAVLTFDRLSRGAGGVYAGVLALKVVAAWWRTSTRSAGGGWDCRLARWMAASS